MQRHFILSKLVFVLLISFCLKAFGQMEPQKFIFISHLYQHTAAGEKVDYRIETFDFSEYAGIWLGGDVCSEAMLNYSTVQYIDSIFNLGNPETHWSLGNHDARNGNWEWYLEFTGRNTFYTYSKFGITRLILNTNIVPTDCESLNTQYQMIISACDSVNSGNHLILIMHHGLWRDVPGIPNIMTYSQSDLTYWNSNCFSVNSTFVESIYPKLVEAKERGVHVYCVLGDMGASMKSIDFLSEDGIIFLGCGLYKNESEDKVLIFTHQPETNQLSYQYHLLDSLLSVQNNNKY